MILGIGNDIIETERVERACSRQSFLARCYTDKEMELFAGKVLCLAGNFAVKESVAKAFGTGFSDFSPKEIEVLRDELGKPYVNLYGRAQEHAEQLGVKTVFVSISNLKSMAAAVAVLEG
jgi:holo-[acyl-carrier protein] synthase